MQKEMGLTNEEAKKRLEEFGLNEIKDISKTSTLKILLRQIKSNAVIYFMIAAMLISFFVGKNVTAYAILAIVILVISAGFIQEYRSEQAISALKGMLVQVSTAIRNGKEEEIQSKYLVPEDTIILRNGEKIPADCVIIEAQELRVNESALTGESKEIHKKAGDEKNPTEENVLYMGTYVVNGRAIAKIKHTGMNTEFGKIAGLISTTEKDLPLQKKVNKIAKYMATVAIIVSILTGIVMFFQGEITHNESIVNILILVVAIAISAFPEGLPVVFISTLSSGVYRMAKHNAIVNRMSIIETLGETTVICSDKTGTITKGEMTVKKIYANDTFFEVTGAGYEENGDFFCDNKKINIKKEPFFNTLFSGFVLCNDARIERTEEGGTYKATGSPTEAALLTVAAKAGIFKEDMQFKRAQEIPFNSERKMMSVLCQVGKEKFVYTKGAPEYVLRHCKYIQRNKTIEKLTKKEREKIISANNKMTSKAMRTVAVAHKKAKNSSVNQLEQDLVFVGLVGMEDPPHEDVKEAIVQCKNAGIEVKMITGDNKETAQAIAKEIGLHGGLIEGHELDSMTDDELEKVIKSIAIFARVKPEHKIRIVRVLKSIGEIVTMTGDGVNDAPALKEAHIGVAMGKNGTDISRSVADLTLKDDRFSTIVLAVSEGRTLFKNIQKFVTYQLSCNFAELSILFIGMLLAPALGWQVPMLLALQLLFMNLVTDNIPAITLGFNPSSDDVMRDMPRKNTQILNKRLIALIAVTGVLLMVFVIFSYYLSHNIFGKSQEYSRTVALVSLIALVIANAFSFRSFRKGVLTRSLFVNPYLVYASIVSFIATIAVLYTPLNKIFETTPLGIDGFAIPIIFSLVMIIIFDTLKIINNKIKFFDYKHD